MVDKYAAALISLAVKRPVCHWQGVATVWGIRRDASSNAVQRLEWPCNTTHDQWLAVLCFGILVSVKMVGGVAADTDCQLASVVSWPRLRQISFSSIQDVVDVRRWLWATSDGRHKRITLHTFALVTQTEFLVGCVNQRQQAVTVRGCISCCKHSNQCQCSKQKPLRIRLGHLISQPTIKL